jgi:hypothetical protein
MDSAKTGTQAQMDNTNKELEAAKQHIADDGQITYVTLYCICEMGNGNLTKNKTFKFMLHELNLCYRYLESVLTGTCCGVPLSAKYSYMGHDLLQWNIGM